MNKLIERKARSVERMVKGERRIAKNYVIARTLRSSPHTHRFLTGSEEE
jgi:hypothetical protein